MKSKKTQESRNHRMHSGTIWSNLLRTSRKLRPRERKALVKSHQKAVAEPKSKKEAGTSLGGGTRGPVVKTPRFQCRGHRFDPWLGN